MNPARGSPDRLSSLDDGVAAVRPLVVADAAEHLAGEDEELVRWLRGVPSTFQGTLAWLHTCEECWRVGGPVLAFGITDVGTHALLGTAELRVKGAGLAAGQAAISYGLYPASRGRGIAVRACLLLCAFAGGSLTADPWDLHEVVAHIDPFNDRSLRVVRRAGFRHVGLDVRAGVAWEVFDRELTGS